MRILHIIQRYPPAVGGSETWCREVSRYLASVGDEVKVLTLDVLEEEEYWRDPPRQQCTVRLGRIDWDDGVLIRRYRRSLPVHTLYHLFFRVVLDRALRIYFYGPHSVEMYGRLFSEVRIADVVHLHTVPYPHNFLGYLAARLFGKRVVITPHFHPGHPHYERWSNYRLLKRCDAVIAVSEYERDYLVSKGIDAGKIVVTGNGVSIEDYLPKDLPRFKADLFQKYQLSEGTRILLFIGRKAEYKGIDTLVEAFRRLSIRHDAALFLVGPPSSWFEEFYGRLPARDRERIIELGAVSHEVKVNLLHLADVLVLPSRFEAFGIVFLEAWVCGTPVIGASTGAIPGIVGDAGLTFEYGNAEDLAEKIEVLLKDDRLSKAMALNGRRKVLERYTWGRIGLAVRRVYCPGQGERLKILICSNLFPPYVLGGAELIAYKQAKVLKALGHDVRIFCGRVGGNMIRPYRIRVEKDEFHKTQVSLSPRDISGDLWDFHNQKITQEFSRVLEGFSPDIVHFHNLVGLSVRMIDECYNRRIPTVLTLHDYWGVCFKNTMLKNDGSVCMKGGFDCLDCKETLLGQPPLPSPVRNSHILLSLNKVDRFIAPSHYLAERYAANGIPREKISVIQNGIDLERFKAVQKKNDMLTLGFIGYLGKHKGVEFLLRSLTLLDDIEKVRLLVVGDGEEAGCLKSLCRELGLDRFVTFYGFMENERIPEIYKKIDVLVVPSVWPENSPVTITEAMASGIPVIASEIGGIGELVEDGVTGFLVPPKDPRALAERIQRFLACPDLLTDMGGRALAKIRGYDLRNQVGCILRIYRELVDRPRVERALELDILLYSSDHSWSVHLREVFRQLAEVEKHLKRRLLICHVDFSDEELFGFAKFLLIPSTGRDSFLHALQALQRQIPLLVHEGVDELKELCLASNAGLFYSDIEELRECLELLLSNESLRKAMGVNGRRFIDNQVAQGAVVWKWLQKDLM